MMSVEQYPKEISSLRKKIASLRKEGLVFMERVDEQLIHDESKDISIC